MVLVAEQKILGRFNACGPEKKLEWGKVIDACVAAASNKPTPHWASLDVLAKFPDASFDIWAPYTGESKGFHTVSNARAVKAGLKFRPIDVIVKDTLAWFKTLPADRQEKLFKGHQLAAETEKAIIAAAG
jgi:2'-hydroxyisoflavone reductase